MTKKTALWRGFTTITASLLAIAVGAGTICESWRENLDQNLGTISSSIKTSDASADGTYTYESQYSSTDELVAAHKDLNERLSEEGSVLLKNNGTLPLKSGDAVTLFGSTSHYPRYSVSAGGSVESSEAVSLEQALTDQGFKINPTMTELYDKLGSQVTGKTEQGGIFTPAGTDIYGNRPGQLSGAVVGPAPANMPLVSRL